MGHWPAEKRKTRFQMLRECQEAASVSKRRQDNTPHWFWLLVRGRECYWHRDWTLPETITDLLKFDLVFSGRVALMSLFLVAVETQRRSFFQWFVVSQLLSEPTHALPVWIHCCKHPNYDFYISQGSVATVLRWGEQNYGHLYVKFLHDVACQKLLTSVNVSRSYSKNNTGTGFFETRCITWNVKFCN